MRWNPEVCGPHNSISGPPCGLCLSNYFYAFNEKKPYKWSISLTSDEVLNESGQTTRQALLQEQPEKCRCETDWSGVSRCSTSWAAQPKAAILVADGHFNRWCSPNLLLWLFWQLKEQSQTALKGKFSPNKILDVPVWMGMLWAAWGHCGTTAMCPSDQHQWPFLNLQILELQEMWPWHKNGKGYILRKAPS